MTDNSLTDAQLKVLTSSLNPARVATRKQGGSTLSYLEAWDVKATLIRVFGFGGFSAEAIDTKIVEIEKIPMPASEGKQAYTKIIACAMVTVRLTIHQTGAVYTESAVASQTGRDIGEVTDFAVKTAESDALKRAAIYLGTQFGLSLYDNGSNKDVVRVIFAPDQIWPKAEKPEADEQKPENAEAQQILTERLGAQPVEES